MSHLGSVHQGCKLPIHLPDRNVPQEVHPLVAEVYLLVSCYIYALETWVGREEARGAMAARFVQTLQSKQLWLCVRPQLLSAQSEWIVEYMLAMMLQQ